MQRKSILKDTIQLTVVQFFLEWVSLLLNVWLTHRIGSATVGIVALTGSFFSWLRSLRMATAFSAPAALYQKSWESPTATLTMF